MLEKKSIPLPNGETYAYLEQGAELSHDNSDVKTFLLIHGNASSSLHYLPLFKRLTNVRLIAPDLRGFGDSTYNSGFSNLGELAEDVKLFADALNISEAYIVGWSTGGGIAFELAVRYPSFAKSLFVIEGMGYKGYPLLKKAADGSFKPYASKEELAADPILITPALSALKSKNAAFFNQLWDKVMYPINKPTEEENALYIEETLKQRNLVDLDWALAVFNMSEEHNGYVQGSGNIGMIRCPVSFTCADHDMTVPPAVIKENASVIKNSTLLEYENCGHSPLVDCPDRLAGDILSSAGLKPN